MEKLAIAKSIESLHARDLEGHSVVRYKVLGLAVCLAAITYLDRVCISVSAPHMMQDFGLTKFQMSLVFSAFTLAYAIFEIPTGWWGDRVGTRKLLTGIVVWWSSFTIATGVAVGYVSLLVIRFLFGAGEAGAWPNVAKTFSRWFPTTERGTAQGIFFMGALLGGSLTPILVTVLLTHMHWRAVFVLFGAIGFLWAAVWYGWFRDTPAQHPAVSRRELLHIQEAQQPGADHHLTGVPWKRILTNRSVIGLCLSYLTQSYGFYFFITWFPTYLQSERGFSARATGLLAGLPLLLGALASLFGGLTTDKMTKLYGARVGRAGVGGVALLLAGVFMITGTAATHNLVSAVLLSLALASANLLLGASWGTCLDIAGDHAGVVSACMNTAGQAGGVFNPIIVAFLLERFGSWNTPLYLQGILYLVGAACWWFVDPREPISDEA